MMCYHGLKEMHTFGKMVVNVLIPYENQERCVQKLTCESFSSFQFGIN